MGLSNFTWEESGPKSGSFIEEVIFGTIRPKSGILMFMLCKELENNKNELVALLDYNYYYSWNNDRISSLFKCSKNKIVYYSSLQSSISLGLWGF